MRKFQIGKMGALIAQQGHRLMLPLGFIGTGDVAQLKKLSVKNVGVAKSNTTHLKNCPNKK